MFASKSITEHLVRGAVGLAGVSAAIVLAPVPGPGPIAASVVLVIIALIALRGCPVCWTVGLVQTLWQQVGQNRQTRPPGPR
ncbi:MAG: hypothetical protein KA085_17190 [Phenylobacterium sp.]|uniref:hypothetical protein n=1 Tax=Phenylobacterium sp. TaxID=1871053 RepID=UPI001B54A8FA|nr:hypothetical protein [Phenylobacterium sp.]MBP7648619.1 hypothetical protein [Phenylobacterium sp.]MBP7817855.1 hypothetical protein [Phenylobacterium sp.]